MIIKYLSHPWPLCMKQTKNPDPLIIFAQSYNPLFFLFCLSQFSNIQILKCITWWTQTELNKAF